ncbi:hypothetical protein GDO86_002474 [Hymenochirus boettgeri]|uniref:Uncharacterized protein n=1 Tax=Hymenochirus boettgeri TaxID=247094 RepID=A0A8T2KK72_9PIPI|nr:hypothetical protein GDO86_002474 [Hymenochirus boettgeri]
MRAQSAPSYPVPKKIDKSLPGDRLSQLTRRGLLSGKRRPDVQYKSLQPTGSGHEESSKAIGRRSVRFPEEDEELEIDRDLPSPWEIPDEINRILNSDAHSLSQDSVNLDDASRILSRMDSESTSSLLSKMDWNAIEDMVAGVDTT